MVHITKLVPLYFFVSVSVTLSVMESPVVKSTLDILKQEKSRSLSKDTPEAPRTVAKAKTLGPCSRRPSITYARNNLSPISGLFWKIVVTRPVGLELLKEKLVAGADVDACMGENGESALHFAAIFGDVLMAKTLLEWGARVDLVKQNGWTPLHIAVSKCHVASSKHDIKLPKFYAPMVKLLISWGADRLCEDRNGQKPSDLVSKGRVNEIMQLLAERLPETCVVCEEPYDEDSVGRQRFTLPCQKQHDRDVMRRHYCCIGCYSKYVNTTKEVRGRDGRLRRVLCDPTCPFCRGALAQR